MNPQGDRYFTSLHEKGRHLSRFFWLFIYLFLLFFVDGGFIIIHLIFYMLRILNLFYVSSKIYRLRIKLWSEH